MTAYTIGGSNYGSFCNQKFDKAVHSGLTTAKQEDRIPFYMEAQRIMAEEKAAVMIAHSVTDVLLNKNVKGFELEPLGSTRFEGVSVE